MNDIRSLIGIEFTEEAAVFKFKGGDYFTVHRSGVDSLLQIMVETYPHMKNILGEIRVIERDDQKSPPAKPKGCKSCGPADRHFSERLKNERPDRKS